MSLELDFDLMLSSAMYFCGFEYQLMLRASLGDFQLAGIANFHAFSFKKDIVSLTLKSTFEIPNIPKVLNYSSPFVVLNRQPYNNRISPEVYISMLTITLRTYGRPLVQYWDAYH